LIGVIDTIVKLTIVSSLRYNPALKLSQGMW
jgi:hypothetical protein